MFDTTFSFFTVGQKVALCDFDTVKEELFNMIAKEYLIDIPQEECDILNLFEITSLEYVYEIQNNLDRNYEYVFKLKILEGSISNFQFYLTLKDFKENETILDYMTPIKEKEIPWE